MFPLASFADDFDEVLERADLFEFGFCVSVRSGQSIPESVRRAYVHVSND